MAAPISVVLCVVLCMLVTLLYATVNVRYAIMWRHHDDSNSCTLADIQTGDIVAFASRFPGITPKAVAMFVGCPFFHVGVAVSNNELLHYIEPNLEWFYRPHRRLCPTGPCFSNVSDLVDAHREHTGRAAMCVLRPTSSVKREDIVDAAMLVARCGNRPRYYEDSFIVSYVTRRFHPVGDTLHCNTFIGVLMEQLGLLPISEHPREDYRPGRILPLMLRSGTFQRVACK